MHFGHGHALILAGGHRGVDRGVGSYADAERLSRDATADAGSQCGRLSLSLRLGDRRGVRGGPPVGDGVTLAAAHRVGDGPGLSIRYCPALRLRLAPRLSVGEGDALGAGGGLTLALVLMAGLREEAELSNIPSVIKGTAMNLIIAGILSLAFMGFAGLFSS